MRGTRSDSRIADSFVFLKNTALGGSANTSVVNEPSVANNGNFIFQAWNWYAGLSSDGGATFSYINPYTTFPTVNNGFCCDQEVLFDPSRDLLIWELMYVPNATGNTLRLAISKGQAALSTAIFYYYDFTPQQLGQPAGNWYDFPKMSRSNNYLFLTANEFTSTSVWVRTVMIKIPLAGLAAGGGFGYSYFTTTTNFSFGPVQGATSTMYWASHQSTSQIRVYSWPESGDISSITSTLVSHSAYPQNYPYACPGPDARSWCGRDDDRIYGGWVANGVLGFMWDASQGAGGLGTFSYPYVHVARFNQSTFALINEPLLWSSGLAWNYPSVAVNSRGHVSGTVFYGGGSSYPSCGVFIWDAYTAPPPAWTIYSAVSSNADPTVDSWGDYLATRKSALNPFTWIGTCYSLQGGGGNANAHPQLVSWGRQADIISKEPSDFDGDRKRDFTVYRPSTGMWYALTSSSAYTNYNWHQWGNFTDKPVSGDYDGDGNSDFAVYRPSIGTWYVLTSSSGFANYLAYQWGNSTDIPIPADYDGDGKTDFAVFRPSTGMWYALTSSSGYAGYLAYQFGTSTDIPVPGDFDGDGKADLAFYRPSNGTWYAATSSSGYSTVMAYQWGNSADIPIPGDYDGDGKIDFAVFRPSTGMWYVLTSSSGYTDYWAYQWGNSTDIPVPGDYDGDGKSDFAIYRPSIGTWYVLTSSSGYVSHMGYQWGNSTDVPVPHD